MSSKSSKIVARGLFVPMLAPSKQSPALPWVVGREVMIQDAGRAFRAVVSTPSGMLDDDQKKFARLHAPDLLLEQRFEHSAECAAACELRNTHPIAKWTW